MADKDLQRVGGSVTTRQDFGGEELQVSTNAAEIAAAAAAAKAEIEARIVVAMKYRRNVMQVRSECLADCQRPTFAEAAWYRKPVGRTKNANGDWENAYAEGFSIRAMEAFLQHYGNVHITVRIVTDTPEAVKIGVGVLDIQNNTGYYAESLVEKLIERREVKKGRKPRGMRENSYGDMVYLFEATKDEMKNLIGAERSKLIRDFGKRLLPADVLEDCAETIRATLSDENAKDPAAARKRVFDKFSEIGVIPSMLSEYLDVPVEALTGRQLDDLRALYTGLKDGDFSWQDVMKMKTEPAEGQEGAPQKLRDILLNPKETPKP